VLIEQPPSHQNQTINLDRERFEQAYERVKCHTNTTPCPKSDLLSKEIGAEVFLKLENQQVSGSFKIRGVTNKVFSLSEDDRKKPLIAASTGNHGAAFAHIVSKLNLSGELFVPENIAAVKREAIEKYGIPLTFAGTDCVETELAASAHSARGEGILIGPYNDIDIILGQGTIGIELMEQLGEVDFVFVPVGGGGLVSGIAAYLKSVASETQIIGCQPENSPVMFRSIQAGHIVAMESLPTLSDATAGGIEPGAITFDLCRALVDEFVILSEDEIFSALRFLHLQEKIIAEGGAAMPVAAVRKSREHVKGKRVALVISGGKIDPSIIKKIGDSHE